MTIAVAPGPVTDRGRRLGESDCITCHRRISPGFQSRVAREPVHALPDSDFCTYCSRPITEAAAEIEAVARSSGQTDYTVACYDRQRFV